eukprot:3843021-Pleurochrysis_carterae.AAC.1
MEAAPSPCCSPPAAALLLQPPCCSPPAASPEPFAQAAIVAGNRVEVAIRSDPSACTTGLAFKRDPRSGALLVAFDDGTLDNFPCDTFSKGAILLFSSDTESHTAVGHVMRNRMG